jgi:hypothetical protein
LVNQDQKNTRDDIKSAYENRLKMALTMHVDLTRNLINYKQVGKGKMLTVMSEQENTIRILSRILGRECNEQHLHDICIIRYLEILIIQVVHTRTKPTNSVTY